MKNIFRLALALSLFTACGVPETDAELPSESAAQDLAEDSLDVRLSAVNESVDAADPVSVTLTLANKSSRTVRVLRVKTAVNGLLQPIFAVERDGVPIDYRGVIATPDESNDAAYLKLEPGQVVAHTVDLASSYDFSASGTYRVVYDSSDPQAEAQLWVAGRAFETAAPNDKAISACNDTQTNRIYLSWGAARDAVNGILTYLRQGAREDWRFRTWFGNPQEWKWSMIQERFAFMSGLFDRRDVACRTNSDANCPGNIAYTYGGGNERIYLCPPFFDSGRAYSGHAYSSAGVFVHEMAHISGALQTPEVYERQACQQLVLDDNWRARNNAQNYDFFTVEP